jgi:hypothetical protein
MNINYGLVLAKQFNHPIDLLNDSETTGRIWRLCFDVQTLSMLLNFYKLLPEAFEDTE